MFQLESQWIATQVNDFAPHATTLIDIGSESLDYRNTAQKYIGDLYAALAAKGIAITTLDSEPTTQADVIQDIAKPLKSQRAFDVVLAANLLEHVPTADLQAVLDNLFALTTDNGIVIITVPYNLPKHDHPIDTMLRPTPDELSDLAGHTRLRTAQWQDVHYREPYISDPTLRP